MPALWKNAGRMRRLLRPPAVGDGEPYVRIGEFLPPVAADALLIELVARRGEFRARGGTAAGDPAFYRMIEPLGPCQEFAARFGELVPLLERRFAADLREARIELLAQAYNDGGSFRRHSDADAGGPNWQRRLSGIFYLHARPRPFEGGALVVHDRRGRAQSVEPDHNSAVFFPRDMVHEVLPVTCASRAFEDSRFALNIWIG